MASRQTLTLSAAGSLRLEVYEFSCRPRAANIFSATAVKVPSHVCELPRKTPITSQIAEMFVDLHLKLNVCAFIPKKKSSFVQHKVRKKKPVDMTLQWDAGEQVVNGRQT